MKTTNDYKIMQMRTSESLQQNIRKQRKTRRLPVVTECQNPSSKKHENNETLQDYGNENLRIPPMKTTKTTKHYKIMQMITSESLQQNIQCK